MRTRVERLRVGLLVSALALMVVLAAFMGWARYLRQHYLAGLPARLGVNVVREANGYTYTQSVQGRKVYTLHAAKAIEHIDGKIAMHDVSMTLYGTKGDRSDRIYGDDFEYDKNAQVVRATGLVHIELESAEAPGRAGGDGSSGKVTRVTTSGLVYLQKLGVAATSNAIEFEAGGMTGHALGADYSSDSGLLVLHSAVTMNGTMSGKGGGHAVALTARTAQFDEHSEQAVLTHATYESEGRRAAADEATLERRADGTLSRIGAKGNVTMEAKGTRVTATRADIALTADSKPQTAVLTGAVKYVAEQLLRQVHGAADEATIEFDGHSKPQPEHAVFAGAVHMTERTRNGAAGVWSVRDLTARKVETSLVLGRTGEPQARDVNATGSPRLSVMDRGTIALESRTEMAADELKAHLVDTGDAKKPVRVDTIVGRGHTLLRQTTADGGEQTIAADSLDAKMRPLAVGAGMDTSASGLKTVGVISSAQERLAETLWSSVQQGHVALMRRVPAKAGAGGVMRENASPRVERALADRAVYDGDMNRLTLSDGVQVSDADSVLWANQVALDQKTGDAHAVGGVKVSYAGSAAPGNKVRANAPPAEPTHVLADRADMVHANGVTTFYGRPVQLWQGGNQIQAPVIELSKEERQLVARSDAPSRAAQVLTVFAGRGSNASNSSGPGLRGTAKTERGCVSSPVAKKGGPVGIDVKAGGVTRIVSGALTFSGAMGQADFTGGFRAETEEGTIRATQGVAYLRQGNGTTAGDAAMGSAAANTAASNAGLAALSGDLDRVIASGAVELDRPGMKATGKKLVYTASDGTAVLTGDGRNPPRAFAAEGTTTGDALQFRSACDGSGGGSVEVLGASGQRVHTDATIADRKNAKSK